LDFGLKIYLLATLVASCGIKPVWPERFWKKDQNGPKITKNCALFALNGTYIFLKQIEDFTKW
jgi:hypothetical protein